MGTRNLTIVVQHQKVKVAQYGQWDGYPEGLGITVLSFLRKASRIEQLRGILPKVRFQSEKDLNEQNQFMVSIGCMNGWMNIEQAKQFAQKYPLHHRDVGGKILQSLLDSDHLNEIVLSNAYAFAADSLFCEWAYVIDFDKNTFEVYRGSNQTPLCPQDRFYDLSQQDEEYQPVKITASFSLDQLPDENEFILQCLKQ